MDQNVLPQPIPRPKKRTRDCSSWKKNKIKRAKLSGISHFGYKNEPVGSKKMRPNEDCKCQPQKCRTKLSQADKQIAFDFYYGCSSNAEKVQYLRSCIVKENRNKFFIKAGGTLTRVCLNFFLAIFDIKYSTLQRKVLKWHTAAKDRRGTHGNRKSTKHSVLNRIRNFCLELEPRPSHYSLKENPEKKFLESNVCIASLYRTFILQNPDLSPYAVLNEAEIRKTNEVHRVKPWLFSKIFNHEFNIGFGFPRSDICEVCERNKVELKLTSDPALLQNLKSSHDNHLIDAKGFYDSMKEDVLSKLPPTTVCLNFDFQKNLPLPVTNTSGEFYSRQLWIINFGIHNLRTGQSTMFLYAETYARKGSNEVVSCLDYYFKNILPRDTKNIMLWCDNCFGQNKNKYLVGFLNSLNDKYDSIEIHFPIPGHTRMSIDREFAQTEKLKKSNDKFSTPSEYVKLIKQARVNDPFQIVYVEHNLTDDLCSDGTPVCQVRDYKSALDPLLNARLGINKIRSFKILQDGKVLTRCKTTGPIVTEFKYIKRGGTADNIRQQINIAQLAYDDYVPVSEAKAKNVEALLKFVALPDSCIFYETLYPMNGAIIPVDDWTSQSQLTQRGVDDDDDDDDE